MSSFGGGLPPSKDTVPVRYARNAPAITGGQQALLAEKHVLVAGGGGLGGYIVELLGRMGVGSITVVDGDVFSETNLNRQLYALPGTLGKNKAECAAERLRLVNPEITCIPVREFLTAENSSELLSGQDLVIDALDNGESRVLLARAARSAGIPLVSGAISGWYGRVLLRFPEDEPADFLWQGRAEEASEGNLGVTAALVAAVEASEAVKLLLNKGKPIFKKILDIDLLNAEYMEIPLA